LNRREVLVAAGAAVVAGAAAPAPFDHSVVLRKARDLSRASFVSPDTPLPQALEALDYDGYRQIRFLEAGALWADLDTPFRAHFFHRGGTARNRVELFEVADGRATPIRYSPTMYSFGKSVPEGLDAAADLGFAGFRLLNPINLPGKFDEIAAFIGASYFRGVAKGGAYGLSARGLAVRAGDWPEEFPVFRSWWLERPGKDAASVVLHGLLDSENVTGAYRFVVTPGATTTMEVTATIFPRKNLERVGFAPLTSMFLFDQETARNYDDFRPAVHDSDGFAVAGIEGTRIWRPLANPARNRATTQPGAGGFGLIQRKTAFADYQDLEARYDLRPSAWVEPVRMFPAGTARLVELTAKTEYEDNIVAEWRADGALPAHVPVSVAYRLHWGPDRTDAALARAHIWRVGAGDGPGWKRLVIDFDAVAGDPETLEATVTVAGGDVRHVVVQPNTVTGGVRLAFNFKPGDGDVRAQLVRGGAGVSELWVYPWSG
jgi:glucans biosynthesis protein